MSKTPVKGTAKVTKRDVFAKAIEVIAQRGWIQGSFQTKRGVCAVGALRVAAKTLGVLPFQPAGLISYNDAKGRTKLDVYLKLAQMGVKAGK